MAVRTYRLIAVGLALCVSLAAVQSQAGEELITSAHYPDGTEVPYILNTAGNNPQYIIILFPGGTGDMDPRMVDGKLTYKFGSNFLIRSRQYIVDDAFATVATNSSQSEERIQAILDDLKRRYPNAQVYLMGTSRGTYDTMRLSKYLQDKIAGVIHTASLDDVATFDARQYKNRQLLVHHRQDACRVTKFGSAEYSHEKYGSELIAIEGGTSQGDDCQPFAYHGFHGIEVETVGKIKAWILQGTAAQKP